MHGARRRASPPDIDCLVESRSRCLLLYWFEEFHECDETAVCRYMVIIVTICDESDSRKISVGRSTFPP